MKKIKKWKGTRNETNTTEGFETKDRSDLSKNRQIIFTRKVKITKPLLMQQGLSMFCSY